MEQKKLTDEEILKALDSCYNSPCCGSDCPYFNKTGRNFCVENKAFYRDMKRIIQEHAEQKAEIERLTEENGWLSKECNKTTAECVELQKQVDELTAFKNEAISMSLYGKGRKDGEEVAVKDTAREIYTQVLEWLPVGEDYHWFITTLENWLKERYDVEVER